MQDRRTEPREQGSFPLKVNGKVGGIMRDLSASGLYFETASEQRVGNLVLIEIELDSPDGPIQFKADGQVVHTESYYGRTGVGVKLWPSRLEAVH